MGTWLQELVNKIKNNKELPEIHEEDIESNMEDDIFSDELGNFNNSWNMQKC